jgi:hypothetical protein
MEHKMKLEIKKFGEVLSSRSAGREAALVTLLYFTKNLKEISLLAPDNTIFSVVKTFTIQP